MYRQPPAPPPTRYGPGAAPAQARAGGPPPAAVQAKAAAPMRQGVAPPPTRYGPAAATQRKAEPAARPAPVAARPGIAPPVQSAAGPSGGPAIQRQILKQYGFTRSMNLAENYARYNGNNGFTPPQVNDTIWNATLGDTWIAAALNPPTLNIVPDGGGYRASVKEVPTNHVGYRMYLPTGGPWLARGNKFGLKGFTDAPIDGDIDPQAQVELRIVGLVSDSELEAKIEAHESVHARDIMTGFDDILVPWDKRLQEMLKLGRTFPGATPEAAIAALYHAAGGTPAEISTRLNTLFIDKDKQFHTSPKGKTKVGKASYNKEKNRITLPIDLTIY